MMISLLCEIIVRIGASRSDAPIWLGFLIEQRVHSDVVNHITEPTMNAKQTAPDAYLARTAAIHAKLERLRQLAGEDVSSDAPPCG
jgi:hypothetical protein